MTLALLLIATAAQADDNRKTAEAGWKAYQKKDLATAEALTRKALAAPDIDGPAKGAALYNLGRILEDKQDKPGAIAAYKESWGLRHNGAVRERLRTLDPAAAAALDPLVPKPLAGPFAAASRDAWCKHLIAGTTIWPGTCADPEEAPSLTPKAAVKLAPPYEELQFIRLVTDHGLVLVKVDGKLYYVEVLPFEESECLQSTWAFDGVTQRGAVLEVAYRVSGSCRNRYGSTTWSERASTIIGIGASKVPSSVELRFALIEDKGEQLNQVRAPTWAKDGASVDVAITKSSGEPFGRNPVGTEDIKGHHAFVFP